MTSTGTEPVSADPDARRMEPCWETGDWGGGESREDTNGPQQPGGCLDVLKSETAGSVGVEPATRGEITLQITDVQVVPSVANGPLGYGLRALFFGRSSASKQGIFVLPGLSDAGYTGNIGITVQTLTPPIQIPEGTRLAQLIPFVAKVPNPGNMQRGVEVLGQQELLK